MSTPLRTSNQSRASTKIVIGFVILIALAYGAYAFWENSRIGNLHYPPLSPTTVNIVGVDTKKGGYHIIVANRIAQLVQSENGAFDAPGQDTSGSEGDDSDAQKKKVPLKEMIQTLQGNSDAVGRYVATLNDMKQEDLPSVQIKWKASDIQKALDGDATLKAQLEKDLNTHLDGTPLPEFRPSTFDRGIVILVPVSMTVQTPQGSKVVSGDVSFPFQTRLMLALYQRVKDLQINEQQLAGYYAEVGKPLLDEPAQRQDVAQALKQIISKENVDAMTQLPQTVLSSIQVLVNDSLIKRASYTPEETPRGTVYNMDIELTDEGRNRLWQYSRANVGTQLLLVVDGVAVAALRIGGELAETHLTISNLPDETIVKDAVNKINA